MNNSTFTKEVTYKLEYNGIIKYEHHYRTENIPVRFRSANADITVNNRNSNLDLIPIYKTNNEFKEIDAILVSENNYFYDELTGTKLVDLVYLLPDVNAYLSMRYSYEVEVPGDIGNTTFSFKLASSIIK